MNAAAEALGRCHFMQLSNGYIFPRFDLEAIIDVGCTKNCKCEDCSCATWCPEYTPTHKVIKQTTLLEF